MSSRPSRGAARLAAILDALPDALLLVNANGTVVNANAIALETFEAPGTALVGRGLLDLLPAFDSKRIPGSMRRPDPEEGLRTKPTRMVARRTDGTEFPVEVTSANLEDARTPYADSHHAPYTGDELLMLVVRDLTGTLDTEAELARQQRQTEMILRAASEGVVGVDTDGKVVLVNPSAAQILGFRASDLGGQELHPLIHHSRPDGSPLPYEETPLADTLRSGRKHRVRGQVLWTKDGRAVPVDLVTAPVREGEQLVGAVMSFTDRTRVNALAARHAQLREMLDSSLRGPLEELRTELSGLANDPAGQLWPEANQILHHLSAGYARMTSLIDNVLGFQRLDTGAEKLERELVGLDEVVAAGVEGAIELIGPGRAQYAVHAPPVEAVVDPVRLAQAISHLIADVAGVDASGRTAVVSGDSTIVVAAAQRGDVVRIEVRGPASGGSAVHLPITRGIVERHGGLLQTHEVPGQGGGSAYVLEVPAGDPEASAGAGGRKATGARSGSASASPDDTSGGQGPRRDSDNETTVMPMPSEPARGTQGNAGAALPAGRPQPQPERTGAGARTAHENAGRTPRPRRPADESDGAGARIPGANGSGEATVQAPGSVPALPGGETREQPTGRRRALRRAEPEPGRETAPDGTGEQPTGRRARRALTDGQQPELVARPAAHALPPAGQPEGQAVATAADAVAGSPRQPGLPEQQPVLPHQQAGPQPVAGGQPAPQGRRARRAVPAQQQPQAPTPQPQGRPQLPREQAALPPAPVAPAQPTAAAPEPTGRRARRTAATATQAQAPAAPPGQQPTAPQVPGAMPPAVEHVEHAEHAERGERDERGGPGGHGGPEPAGHDAHDGDAHAISVRTLGQGTPFAQPGPAPAPVPATPQSQPQQPATGSGRRRKLANPQQHETGARQHPGDTASQGVRTAPPQEDPAGQAQPLPAQGAQALGNPAFQASDSQGEGQAFAIGAPAEGAEGPEMLDGPGGAVEVTASPATAARPAPQDAAQDAGEAPSVPRRLLVWPEPDVSTRQALTDRGYRPVTVRSREEVDAQVAEYPAALFVDPLTGPITRTALQSLRAAAVAAEVPVLVTAGLGQATREAAYGADPAVLLKALAPRDSDQHPPRVLLVESHQDIAAAFTATLERRGMQVAHAADEEAAAALAARSRPNLVVMDLMLIRRRRVGIVDWLRANGLLTRTPLVVYTSVDIDAAELPRLSSGETVLFLAERSTSPEVQGRIVDLLSKIGAEA
ncbi:PAS domain-containing protein [Streptomyces sp. ICBB 8177]|uniref:PAS domain-containing protein n=1 Tax=Streptomyces sp. ICBB 8177 TaxID=563922 RepID=UPI000D6789D2|nr:PAS domain-containing protein [Streptomyces sp. ICBB 8177]PWI41100.1 PAS domain S-box protein [Streptomyces sp. ICBB 8177]